MAAQGRRSPLQELRRCGVRLHDGPWTMYVGRGAQKEPRVIIALGRTAGPAVTRSRVRRVARTVFGESRAPYLDGTIFLTARASVATKPRSRVRADFLKLKERVARVLAHQPEKS